MKYPAKLQALTDAKLYEYTSADGTTKIVATFTPEAGKDYTSEIPPKTTSDISKPTAKVYNVIVSNIFKFNHHHIFKWHHKFIVKEMSWGLLAGALAPADLLTFTIFFQK